MVPAQLRAFFFSIVLQCGDTHSAPIFPSISRALLPFLPCVLRPSAPVRFCISVGIGSLNSWRSQALRFFCVMFSFLFFCAESAKDLNFFSLTEFFMARTHFNLSLVCLFSEMSPLVQLHLSLCIPFPGTPVVRTCRNVFFSWRVGVQNPVPLVSFSLLC